MNEKQVNCQNLRLKRTNNDDKIYKDEPPNKSQRLYLPFNDDQFLQEQIIDSNNENSEITEHNYEKIIATTIYKKLQILETHDRVLRSINVENTKQVNVDEINAMKGTCLDMCPEKERLWRIYRNMVSQFECKIVDSKLEPSFEIMVKQYARSSADQANPLPHELRPTHVLVKTMNYLLKNIIYPIESNIEQDLLNWYDFCWDRMRAIRKDIVQQNLQSIEVITILEQIGRFHIACYDLMLGYPGFDIKLNTENLNNCIQMLMPMYKDSDQQCPNETEFVSYELLMHLGNPQFHIAYDLLPTQIKKSSEVKFCIKAHTTYLQSCDCITFFKLLESTSYMNCCILQRVIPSIRYNSLKIMNISYTTAKRIYKLEIEQLKKRLCFDNIQLAQEFCSEIQIKSNDLFVDLSRKIELSVPEHRTQRQESIILQKRQNLTFLICGNQNLPDVIISSVHSSFNYDDRFNNQLNININDEISNDQMETYSDISNDDLSSNSSEQISNAQISTHNLEIPIYTFNLPNSNLTSHTSTNLEITRKTPLSPLHDSSSNQLNILNGFNSHATNNLTNSSPIKIGNDLPFRMHSNSVQLPYNNNVTEKLQLTYLNENQIILAKKFVWKWRNYVNNRKSKYIDIVESDKSFLYDCDSSLSTTSTKSLNLVFNITEESKEWKHMQYYLAEKYFYIWLKKVLRKRRKIKIDPVSSIPWSVFVKVHGAPKETFTDLKIKDNKHLKIHNNTIITNDDISIEMANVFVKNILDTQKIELIEKKIFWKLAVNYGELSNSHILEKKVQAIIYGKTEFSNNQVQNIYTDYSIHFIKSVQSCVGLQNWTKSGVNAILVFTNTIIEDIETLFKRVQLILQSTPIAVPLFMIFSSNSNINEIQNYQLVLDSYRENEYINNYSVSLWEGPKTVLEAIDFFSKNYVDIIPGMRSEKLFYNLLNFAQPFFLKMRQLLPKENPNIIIEKYNQYLNAYIKRLGADNYLLEYIAPEFISFYTQNAGEFSEKYSNLNLNYFEELLNDAHILPFKSWPPNNVNDLIDYIKNICQLTNCRCWCLDILQILNLDRNADLDKCLLNFDWYEVIEMWIEGALQKCSAVQDFTVFYNGKPTIDVLKTIFPNY